MTKKSAKTVKTIDLENGTVTEQLTGDPGSQLATLPVVKHASVIKSDAAAFAALGGEVSFGMQIIKLEVGEAAGPFILKEVLLQQDCTPQGAKKKFEPVDVYVATDAQKMEIRMPIAASFIGKAKDMKLSAGDEFHIMRLADYKSKSYDKNGQSFALAITHRAKGGK